MAKITWTFKNEEGTNLNRYIATNVSTGEKITFDLLRGGNISVVGTPLNAENLNALITSINACYDLISSSEKDTTYTLSKNGNAIRLTSSDGTTNDVTLNKSDIGLGNVDNTSDMDKPISTATQQALEEVKEEFENHIVECNCSHEVEITGFGEEDCNLVIDDQDAVITKIQGQTRRKSLNLWKGGNLSYTVEYDGYQVFDVANIDALVGDTITIKFKSSTYTDVLKFLTAIGKEGYVSNIDGVYTLTFTLTSGSNKLFYISGHVGEIISFNDIQINKGSTALPYEPYDNTLVNSKCDFVSTGRNLLKSDLKNVSANMTYTLGNVALKKGRYEIKITSRENLGAYTLSIINEYYDVNLSGGIQLNSTFSFTLNKDYPNATLRSYFNGTNTNINIYVSYNEIDELTPYVEDTMQCGIELGAFDYHDNVNHITHRQTSEMITLNGSEDWRIITESNGYGLKVFGIAIEKSAFSNTDNSIGVSNNGYAVKNTDNNWVQKNSIGVINNNLYIGSDSITTVDDFKSWLQANPISLVYKLATETTEENILPSGYKVWYKGMQVQKTDTIPYILTKQYGISLASQVLNNVSIDRSQQKQIDSLKKEIDLKANKNETYTKSETDKELSYKVDKVDGKGLSTNDFTNELKSKLESLSNYDDRNIQEEIEIIIERLDWIERNLVIEKTKDVHGKTTPLVSDNKYSYFGSITVDGIVKSASFSTINAIDSEISYSGNQINFTLYGKTSGTYVSGTIIYTYGK